MLFVCAGESAFFGQIDQKDVTCSSTVQEVLDVITVRVILSVNQWSGYRWGVPVVGWGHSNGAYALLL